MSALMALRMLLLSLLLPTASASSFKSIEELAAAALSVVVPEAPAATAQIQKSSSAETDQGNETDTEDEDDEDDSGEVEVVSDKKAAAQGAALVQVHHAAEKAEKQAPKAAEHTEIQKQAAKPLPTVPEVHPSQAVQAAKASSPVLFAKPSPAEEVAHRYGPHGCVKTFLAERSRTCIVKTECSTSPGFAEFDMGFRCASASDGSDDSTAVVHLFGAQSFAAEETFDTKIGCAKCLPLEDKHQTVNDLASEVVSLRQNLAAVSSSMDGLQQKVISAIQLRGGHGQ